MNLLGGITCVVRGCIQCGKSKVRHTWSHISDSTSQIPDDNNCCAVPEVVALSLHVVFLARYAASAAAKGQHWLFITWFMSCRWPVNCASGLFEVKGSHKNIVKSSEPLTRRSGRSNTASLYLAKAACVSTNITSDRLYDSRYRFLLFVCTCIVIQTPKRHRLIWKHQVRSVDLHVEWTEEVSHGLYEQHKLFEQVRVNVST